MTASRRRRGRATKETVVAAADRYARAMSGETAPEVTGPAAEFRNAFKDELMDLVEYPLNARKLRFYYTNWRGQQHQYTVRVEGLTYGTGGRLDAPAWMLNGYVLLRDGKERREFDVPQRRSFVLTSIKNPTEVE